MRNWMHSSNTRMMFFSAAAIAALFGPGASASKAQTVVFTNSGNGGDGYFSDVSSGYSAQQTFSFATQQTFDTVDWVGNYESGHAPLSADNFTIFLYDTVGGVPTGAPIMTLSSGTAGARTDTGSVMGAAAVEVYDYSFDYGSDITLAAGTYALGIQDNSTGWAWALSRAPVTATDQIFETGHGNSSTPQDVTAAFSLIESNTVTPTPEPGMVVTGLSMLSMTGLGLVRGRMRCRKNSGAVAA